MKHLSAINKYFWKYKKHFFFGILFIVVSNYFRILSPQISGYVVDKVQHALAHNSATASNKHSNYDYWVQQFIVLVEAKQYSLSGMVIFSSITILLLAILSGVFMFLMRQTIIVMSRHIEYEQKNEVYAHYQKLHLNFYKTHSTGDLMNRIAEDISKVRMYTGPALMYFINLAATIGFCIYFMVKANWLLTLYVLSPLPILAIIIYLVNTYINKKSEKIQAQLSDLTTTAQESYSGIRVIKSFVQEKAMLSFFTNNSNLYRSNAVGLAKLESIYFPSMALLIGLSTLITICMGCIYAMNSGATGVTVGTITEFVIYVNMLTFPVSAIGWTASMIQRGAASQKRLNEFLNEVPAIQNKEGKLLATDITGDIIFKQVHFTYPNTGIHALVNLNLTIRQGQKVLIMGKTGSGKTTIAQLLLRFYDQSSGNILINGCEIQDIDLKALRSKISYVPQDVFLFSDTIANNIQFAMPENNSGASVIETAAQQASIHQEIMQFEEGYDTIVGERGVTLSGGQKQRISIARALIKNPEILIFDDCLSAVDARTEHTIVQNLKDALLHKTALIISHRIFTSFQFDKILIIDNGQIIAEGTHEELLQKSKYYSEIYMQQTMQEHL